MSNIQNQQNELTNSEIWDLLINKYHISKKTTMDCKDMIIWIYKNNEDMIIKNLTTIIDPLHRKGIFEMMCVFARKTELIDLVIKEYQIDTREPKYGSVIITVCRFGSAQNAKYLIKNLGFDPTHIQPSGTNCLINCQNVDIVKFLVEECKMDPLYENNSRNVLFNACCSNNLELLSYLVEVYGIDLNVKNRSSHTCLMMVCAMNGDLNTIKYLIENKADPTLRDASGQTCLFLACMCNTNGNTIKYLIEEVGIDPNQLDNDGNNLLGLTCQYNPNIDVIKYLISLGLDPEDVNYFDEDSLALACRGSGNDDNLHVVKYLIDKIGMNWTRKNNIGMSYLDFACTRSGNHNLSKIKYLVEEKSLDYKSVSGSGNTCLITACHIRNIGMEIIKYLVEGLGVDINKCNYKGFNCLTKACEVGGDINLIKYFIEERNMICTNIYDECHIIWDLDPLVIAIVRSKIFVPELVEYLIKKNDEILRNEISRNNFARYLRKMYETMSPKNICTVIGFFKDYFELFNIFLILASRNCTVDAFLEIVMYVKTINPLLFDKQIYDIYEIDDPWIKKNYHDFKKFKNNVDIMSTKIHFRSVEKNSNIIVSNDPKKITPNYSRMPEKLFVYNGKTYYGNKEIIYSSMCVFDNVEMNDPDEPIPVLDSVVKISDDLINMYIHSCYTQHFDLFDISVNELVQFLRFIDQYPTKNLSIDTLEDQLVQYIGIMDNYQELKNDCALLDLVDKYQLRDTYAQMHNIKIMTK